MDYAVPGHDVGTRDLRIADAHVPARRADICGCLAAGNHVAVHHRGEFVPVAGVEQAIQRAMRQLPECIVRGGEHGVGTRSVERGGQAGPVDRLHEGAERMPAPQRPQQILLEETGLLQHVHGVSCGRDPAWVVANGRGRSIDLAPGHRHAQCGERKRG